MIEIVDIPIDEETHHVIGASTGTKYSAYIKFREKYTCKDFIEAVVSDNLNTMQKIHCITAISVSWDDIALSCYDELLKSIPDYKISDISTTSSLVMSCLAHFATPKALDLVRKYSGIAKVRGTKYAEEQIKENIRLNRDPIKTWGKANAKC